MTSKCPTRSRSTAGFTLVELLVAMTLIGLISVALFGGLRFGARAWEAGNERAESFSQLEVVQSLLRRELNLADSLLGSDGRFSFVIGGGNGQTGEQPAAQVDPGRLERLPPEIERDDVVSIGIDRQQSWRFADCRGVRSDLDDQAILDQLAHQRGNGRPGEVGDPRNGGPADLRLIVNGFEDEAGVVFFGLLTGRFAHGEAGLLNEFTNNIYILFVNPTAVK